MHNNTHLALDLTIEIDNRYICWVEDLHSTQDFVWASLCNTFQCGLACCLIYMLDEEQFLTECGTGHLNFPLWDD